ncbi:helix-turn-helix domain-containing protein [Sorangium sp. So ce1078]|uniref:helix-turn-helix domain-containing protein n=1 Tax=Sorangium sp. So ce1078 TaxID=3133329 RepID=UPI003F60F38F
MDHAFAPNAAREERIAQGTSSIGVHVELRTELPGRIELARLPHHLLKVHAGAPVRGICGLGGRFLYRRGDVDLFPAGTTSTWEHREESAWVALGVPPALLTRAAREVEGSPEHAALEPRYQFRDAQIEHIAWALEAESRAGFPHGRLYTESLGMALALHLLGARATPAARRDGLPRRTLDRVIEYVEAHLHESLSLDRLSGVAELSSSHFRAQFKRSTGLPVYEYVIQRRVARARALLARGELPAAQVALAAGFAHQSHMARCMRRVLGVTPRAIATSRDARGRPTRA